MLQFLILIAYVAGPNLWFRCDKECALELDGACGGGGGGGGGRTPGPPRF